MISSNDVLNEKEKLALEDLLPFALEKVKKRKEKKRYVKASILRSSPPFTENTIYLARSNLVNFHNYPE